MAKGPALNISVLVEDYFSSSQTLYQQNTIITSTPFKEANLICQDKGFVWKSSLARQLLIKKFVCDELNIHGSWRGSEGIYV